jgi:predicted nucleic acid-binding protein
MHTVSVSGLKRNPARQALSSPVVALIATISIPICLAVRCTGPALLMIDQRSGRAVVQELGITVAGSTDVIGLARQRGMIPTFNQVFAALHAIQFRMHRRGNGPGRS